MGRSRSRDEVKVSMCVGTSNLYIARSEAALDSAGPYLKGLSGSLWATLNHFIFFRCCSAFVRHNEAKLCLAVEDSLL